MNREKVHVVMVAMRLVDETHPRLGNKYRIYPMMNFSVAVDDHLMGMTHVLRGKDHLANSEKQKYLYVCLCFTQWVAWTEEPGRLQSMGSPE